MDQTLIRPDGRAIAWTQHGAPDGAPVFLFHGEPGSRLVRHPDDSIAQGLGLRLIGVDRPGYGSSTLRQEGTLLTFAADVAALADSLGLERFAIVGISGGGPYALACAKAMPDRVTRVALIGSPCDLTLPGALEGWSPAGAQQMMAGRAMPEALRPVYTQMAQGISHAPDLAFQQYVAGLAPCDQAVLTQPAAAASFKAEKTEAVRAGIDGWLQDTRGLAQPWPFVAGEVSVPVDLWHGELDNIVPVSTGKILASLLPDVTLHLIPEAGHYLWLSHWAPILSRLQA